MSDFFIFRILDRKIYKIWLKWRKWSSAYSANTHIPSVLTQLYSVFPTLLLFHHLTRTANLYNGCLAWYNVVLTSRVDWSVKYSQQSIVTAAVSCDGGISVSNHCLLWSKFVNTHLYHSRQWFNIHLNNTTLLYLTINTFILYFVTDFVPSISLAECHKQHCTCRV